MKSKMKAKPVAILAGLGLLFLLSFQNCSKAKNEESPQYGYSESSSVLASEKDTSVINLPVFPEHFGNLTQGVEIYGNCIINNVSRDFILTVIDRSGKRDCASKCNDNLLKFNGDKITCSYPGGSNNTSIETAKNYCRIVTGEKDVKIDSYQLDRPSCVTQCQILAKDSDKNVGLRCEWQKQVLFLRISDNQNPVLTGACEITAKNAAGSGLATLKYNSGTTEESCSNIVTQIKAKYSITDVTYIFTKDATPIIQ